MERKAGVWIDRCRCTPLHTGRAAEAAAAVASRHRKEAQRGTRRRKRLAQRRQLADGRAPLLTFVESELTGKWSNVTVAIPSASGGV